MALDPNRWTLKTQEAVNTAIAAARSASNPEVTPDHLLLALLGQASAVSLPRLSIVPTRSVVICTTNTSRPNTFFLRWPMQSA